MKNKFKFLALAIMALLSVNVWSAVTSGTTYNTESTSSLPTGWSGSGGGTSYIQLTASSNYIKTDNFQQGGFTSIKIKARKYGGPSDAQAKITVSWYDKTSGNETVLGTVTPTNTTLTDYTISSPSNPTANTEGYIKIQCKGASSSKGSGVSQVTITYKAAVVRTVAWKVNNETYTAGNPTTQVNDGAAVTTLPTAPTTDCGGKTFVGWTATANYEHATAAPGDLFNTAVSAPTVSGSDVTYHAVFADAGGSGKIPGTPVAYDGSGSMTLGDIKGVTISGLGSDYDPNTQGEYILKFDNTGDYIQFALDYPPTSLSFNYKMVGGGNTSTMHIKECSTASGTYSTVQSFSISGSQNSTGTKTTTSSFSQKYIRMEFTKGSNVGVGKITIQGYINGTSYSNYTTTCATCTAISPTLSYTATATVGQVLNPTLDKKGSSGAVTYSIKSGSSNASINASTGALTCSAAGTVTVQATIAAAGDYCEGTATSNTITISEPSYTITATKNDASLGNVSLSGKVITATPNTCVGYANPAYTVTSGSATVSQSGNKFTVTPSSNCTICINFDELEKDTYVDNLHGNTTIEECGSYTAPLLSDAPKATTGDCDVLHYHFAGWVTKTISTGTTDAPSGMITAGTNMNSTGEEYIAVWAREE